MPQNCPTRHRRSIKWHALFKGLIDGDDVRPDRDVLHGMALAATLKTAALETERFGLLLIDVDHFKTINDTFGHAVGDRLLVDVARRLQDCVQLDGHVVRIGGDEFVVVLRALANHAEAEIAADHLSKALNRPINIEYHEINVTISIGVSMFPRHGDGFETLLRYADRALYSAEEKGRNRTWVFTSDLETRLRLQIDLEASVRRDRLDEEFFLLFRPRPKVAGKRVACVEALLR